MPKAIKNDRHALLKCTDPDCPLKVKGSKKLGLHIRDDHFKKRVHKNCKTHEPCDCEKCVTPENPLTPAEMDLPTTPIEADLL